MKLLLKRNPSSDHSTQGKLSIDGNFFCFTLEDVVRPSKIAGETAIPAGTYKVIINQSNRFKRLMPLLLGVPGFEGVRIHYGNTNKDTEGCILVGETQATDFVGNSRSAFYKLFVKLQTAFDAGEGIEITIEGDSHV